MYKTLTIDPPSMDQIKWCVDNIGPQKESRRGHHYTGDGWYFLYLPHDMKWITAFKCEETALRFLLST